MRLVPERGVPQEEREGIALGSLTDWDAARVFLEVVRRGSFRSAAERLELSINVVRRRIDDFERQVGATLFTRDVHGTHLTAEGSLIVSAVERMEAASFDLLRAGNSAANTLSGEVRVAVTEGLGTFWLAPRLVEFQQAFPQILIDLHCAMRSADVSRYEADVAIHLSRPTALDVKLVKLGRMHLMFFASQKYIDIFGAPKTLEELTKHRLVMQVVDQTSAKEGFESWFPGRSQRELVVMKTNVSSANYWAVASGAGIGLFPTYACALGGKIVPLDIEIRRGLDIWLSYHPGSGNIPRVRSTIDWLVEAFNATKFPWFRDEFIHPYQLKAVYKSNPSATYSGASRPKDGKTRMNKSAAKKMKQRSAGKPDIELGKRIRLRRVEQRISQAELGDQLGVSFQQVQKYEKGVNRVGAARLQQIATALDVPVTFFYDGDGKAREVESLLFLDSSFSLRLLRAYSKIKDQTVQRQLVSLMESIAANED